MKKAVICVLPVLLFLAACGGAAPDEFTTRDAGSIRQHNDAFVAAFNGKEVPKVLNLYAENSVFMPPNQPIIRGKDALKNFYEDMMKQGATNLKLNVDEVSGHGPIAYLSGTYEMDLKPASGGPGRDRGKYLFVVRKMGGANGSWKYEYTMWNSDLPAATETAAAK